MVVNQIVVERKSIRVDEGTMGFHDYVDKKEDFNTFIDRVTNRINKLHCKRIIGVSYPDIDKAIIAYEVEE